MPATLCYPIIHYSMAMMRTMVMVKTRLMGSLPADRKWNDVFENTGLSFQDGLFILNHSLFSGGSDMSEYIL